jgi:hypothetical protein
MIIVKLQGGIGNQLFQYAYGKSVSTRLKEVVKFDASFYTAQNKRAYSLDFFNTAPDIATATEIQGARQNYIKEHQFNFSEQLAAPPSGSYIDGYFQSERYFKDNASEIRNEYTLKNPFSGNATSLKSTIEHTDNTVSLHIRRGDYVSDKKTNTFHGVLPLSYYEAAINLMTEKIGAHTLFVFTDDPTWVADEFSLSKNFILASRLGSIDYEELLVMSSCKHHILANSSFSWWGAWLNPHKDTTVIAPRNWFANQSLNTKDLLPEHWIRI